MNKDHPIHQTDDIACRWLCESAGKRTRDDEAEIASALEIMPHQGGVVPPSRFPCIDMLRRVK